MSDLPNYIDFQVLLEGLVFFFCNLEKSSGDVKKINALNPPDRYVAI